MGVVGFISDLSLIKEFAESQGYFYYLARMSQDFFNLVDESREGLYIFHAQDKIDPIRNTQTNGFISNNYTGKVWIAKKSYLDGVIHNDKIIEVERIMSLQIDQDFKNYFCKHYFAEVTNVKPFYNLFSTNYDGIMFDYKIEVQDNFILDPLIKDNYIRNGIFEIPI